MKYALFIVPLATALLAPAFSRAVTAQAKPTAIYVSVVDDKGEAAKGLAAADFHVKEDGVTREVLSAGPATDPLTVALIVDDSQAATPAIQMIREGAENFVTALAGKAEISLQTFGERPTVAVEVHDGTRKGCSTASTGSSIAARARARALLEAIVEASKGLEKKKAARPVIAVMMIDRGVEFSNDYYKTVLRRDRQERGLAERHLARAGAPEHDRRDSQPRSGRVDWNGPDGADAPRQCAGVHRRRPADETARGRSCSINTSSHALAPRPHDSAQGSRRHGQQARPDRARERRRRARRGHDEVTGAHVCRDRGARP